jgi:hypothetical protein
MGNKHCYGDKLIAVFRGGRGVHGKKVWALIETKVATKSCIATEAAQFDGGIVVCNLFSYPLCQRTGAGILLQIGCLWRVSLYIV